MDISIVYTKTAKGILELKNGTKGLSASHASVLRKVDGSSSINTLFLNLSLQDKPVFEVALKELEARNFIRVFSRAVLAEARDPETHANLGQSVESNALYAQHLPTIQIEEMNLEEGVLAWAEARRGVRELTQLGFYTPSRTHALANDKPYYRVLIVEDDENIATLIKTYLMQQNFTARIIADGQQALHILDETSIPDLILLDVNLPGVNGFDILAYVRSDESLKNLPVIMVTAQVTDIDVLRGLKEGADGYIFKPFEWATLDKCIKRVLNRIS